MENDQILDEQIPGNQKEQFPTLRKNKQLRIISIIEVAFWTLCILEYFIWNFYTRKILLEVSFFPFYLLSAFSVLALFYLLFPTLIFRSEGWIRHMGSYALGLVIFAGLTCSFLRLDHVFYDVPQSDQGTLDLCTGILKITFTIFIVTCIVFFIGRNSPLRRSFYWAVLIRFGIVLALLAFSVFVIQR